MPNYRNTYGIPSGLGGALEQCNVITDFFTLPEHTQQEIIKRCNKIKSKKEIHSYVESLIDTNVLF